MSLVFSKTEINVALKFQGRERVKKTFSDES